MHTARVSCQRIISATMNIGLMNMKLVRVAVGCLALTFLLLAVAGTSSASTSTLGPGESHTVKLKVDAGEFVTYVWSAGADLRFVMKSPDGTTMVDVTDTTYDYFFTASQGGTYTLKWTNVGSTTTILTFSSPLQEIGHTFDVIFWGVVIGGIVIVAVIVVVIVLSLMKKGRAPQPGMTPQVTSQYAVQAAASGKCPVCGSPVEPQGMFCAKCGAKLR